MSERVIVPNIYGVETEYSTLLTFPGDQNYEIVGKCHSVNEQLGLYAEPKSAGGAHIGADNISVAFEKMGLYMTSIGMLSNGGRFYIDPSGPEYDAPETTTAEEAVHRSFDGDSLVIGMLVNLREAGILQDFQLNRRIVDHTRSSRGVHLNTTTSLPAEVPSPEVQEALYLLNVVKGSMFGSGGLLVDKTGKTAFHHSPRLSITTHTDSNYSNYRDRPLVRHPFKGDGESLARAETVTSDALNFGWPLKASLVATNSLFRLIELGRDIRFPVLRDPIKAAHIVGQYGYKNQIAITQADGRHVGESPHKILAKMCEVMISIDEKESFLDDEARQVLPEIIDVADRISSDVESVATQVESVARFLAMQRKMDQKGVKLNSETMCRFDYAWDWIGGGIAENLRNKNLVGWQGFKVNHSFRTVAKRRNLPPTDTRAKVRGEIIEGYKGAIDIDWVGTEEQYLHPLDTDTHEYVSRLTET